MNKETAKKWLSAYHEGLEFEDHPELNQALAMAESDPEIREWWQDLKRIDAALSEAVHEVPIPAGLEDQLFETVHRGKQNFKQSWIPRNTKWIGALAALLVLGTGGFLYLRHNEQLVRDIQTGISGKSIDNFEQFRDSMAYYVRSVYFRLDHLTQDLGSIDRWLNESRAPTYEALPEELVALQPIGCKQLNWRGRNVSLVCFHTSKGKIIHLFILERSGVDDSAFSDIQRVALSHELETGGWLTEEKAYILVGSDPSVDIEFALG